MCFSVTLLRAECQTSVTIARISAFCIFANWFVSKWRDPRVVPAIVNSTCTFVDVNALSVIVQFESLWTSITDKRSRRIDTLLGTTVVGA